MTITHKIASLILSIALGFGLGALTSTTSVPGQLSGQLASPVDSFKPLGLQLNPFNQNHGGKGR